MLDPRLPRAAGPTTTWRHWVEVVGPTPLPKPGSCSFPKPTITLTLCSSLRASSLDSYREILKSRGVRPVLPSSSGIEEMLMLESPGEAVRGSSWLHIHRGPGVGEGVWRRQPKRFFPAKEAESRPWVSSRSSRADKGRGTSFSRRFPLNPSFPPGAGRADGGSCPGTGPSGICG